MPPASAAARSAPSSAREDRRRLAVDAFLDLVLAGEIPPPSEAVASRAGISMATLFRYFDSLDELRHEAAQRAMARFPHLYVVPEIGVGPRAERIERFAALRVELWEKTHRLALLLRSAAVHDRGAARLTEFARKSMAEQVRQHFASELRRQPAARREGVVATVASLTSVESWDQFRNASGRSPAQTRRAWAHAIDRILKP